MLTLQVTLNFEITTDIGPEGQGCSRTLSVHWSRKYYKHITGHAGFCGVGNGLLGLVSGPNSNNTIPEVLIK